ncbi:hypothetical protein NW762_010487 [Fusarium torreyae]|uniref:Uncharacterized protein n=1 Tax=Fusarium torreyae TaxID=1237075 RepID=A0A9W8VBF3_9HYPO|nr:hypothetical protein NW762_010487 [Fusarium torreyae]
MADDNHDVPAPSEAHPLMHAEYQDVQVARLQAEISQLQRKTGEAAYWDQLRQQKFSTLQNEKTALQANNNALQLENGRLQTENNALQRENNALQIENSALLIENTRLVQSHRHNNQHPEANLQDGNNHIEEEEFFIKTPNITPSPPLSTQDSSLPKIDRVSTEQRLTGNKNVDEGIDIQAPWAYPSGNRRAADPCSW